MERIRARIPNTAPPRRNRTEPMSARPNIIFIITDQQRFDTIAAAGFDYMDTPNLDRLHREGIVFNNTFITAAGVPSATT